LASLNPVSTPQAKLQAQLEQVPWLRGRGPVSYNYGQWVDETHSILVLLYGENSAEETGFLGIVGEGAEARGWGLPLAPDNQWGMQARLDRAETYLLKLLGVSSQKSAEV
jgi:hypothetical protein